MKTLTVSENIVNYIRGEIVFGRLKSGAKIKENDLAINLGVSNAPIREALRFLQNEYLVTIIPRKGAFVTEISIEDCHHIYEVRQMIECFCIELLQKNNITDIPHETKTKIFTHQLLPDDISKERKDFIGLFDSHFNLVEVTGNEWLLRLYKSIATAIVRYQVIFCPPGMTKKFEIEHDKILKLINKGSYSSAKEILSNHIRSNFELIANQMIKKL